MKKYYKSLFFLLFSMFFLLACSSDNRSIKARIFSETFEANLSDGELWQCEILGDASKSCVKLIDSKYSLEGEGKDAKGYYSFFFQLVRTGQTQVSFTKRKMDSPDKVEKEITKTYTIANKGNSDGSQSLEINNANSSNE